MRKQLSRRMEKGRRLVQGTNCTESGNCGDSAISDTRQITNYRESSEKLNSTVRRSGIPVASAQGGPSMNAREPPERPRLTMPALDRAGAEGAARRA